ncbi:MAG: fucose isomerase [Bacteroidales bacterium]|nr:fucose isomerase [Bacteroidales bacterium]MBN2763555.1 fucose isomerase [Bacteroidales bacterium]
MAYKKKLTFGLIVGTRNIFNAKLAEEARAVLLKKMNEWGYDTVILPSEETPTGNIETYQDAKKCAALFSKNRDIIDGVIVVLPNFGDELGIVNTLNRAKLDVPVLIQACDDDNDKVDVHSRRDAFCGKLSVCNNLYQYGIPFSDTTYHTYPLDSELFAKDVAKFAGVCRVVGGIKGARIGQIGTRPQAFQTMRASEKILQATGMTVIPVDLSEIFAAAGKIDDNAKALVEKIDDIKNYGKIAGNVMPDKIRRQAKFGLAVENWMAVNEIDAAGIQCWESIENNYGCAACLTMSMLGEKLMPCACETDLTGVVSMYTLMLASGTPSALLDWNNNFGEDRNKCVCTHCSNYPKSFFRNEIEIGSLDVLGTVLGSENTFGAVKGKVTEGPLTFFRISTDDPKGCIKSYLGEGRITSDPYGMDGGIAVTEIPNLQKLMKYLCKNGFEHHVSMCRGHVADTIEDAIGNYLDWDLYRHG